MKLKKLILYENNKSETKWDFQIAMKSFLNNPKTPKNPDIQNALQKLFKKIELSSNETGKAVVKTKIKLKPKEIIPFMLKSYNLSVNDIILDIELLIIMNDATLTFWYEYNKSKDGHSAQWYTYNYGKTWKSI